MYTVQGQGQTTLWGQKIDVNRYSLSLCQFVARLKKNSLKTDFFLPFFYVCVFFFFFSHVYSPRQRLTTHWGQKFYDNRKAFFPCPHVESFKMIASKFDIIHIFKNFINVNIPGAKSEHTFGTNF